MTNNYEDNIQTQITIEAQKSLDETRKKEKEDIENLYSNNFNENKKIMEEEFNQKVKYLIKPDIFYLSTFPPISVEDYLNRIYNNTK